MTAEINGLGTFTITTIQNTGIASIEGKIAAPRIPNASQVVVLVKQNGSTIFTTSAGQQGFKVEPLVAVTAGDVISLVVSSSLVDDQQSNAVKMTVTVSEGSP